MTLSLGTGENRLEFARGSVNVFSLQLHVGQDSSGAPLVVVTRAVTEEICGG
jgi:hypothetical protein